MIDGKQTEIIAGSYEEERLGWMVKTNAYPGGYPADRYDIFIVIEKTDTPNSPAEVIEAEPPVSFELAIIDEVEPVKITAALIRQKSKVLTDLTIANIFDEAGYKKVKAAVQKAVKTRTSIEKQEKIVVDAMKLRHASEKKEVTDYTAELYVACREAQTNLENKLKVIDDEKAIAAKKLEDEEKARTEGRDNKMYELGMTFNGQAFIGYGKAITKNSLYSLDNDSFAGIVTELEGLKIEQDVTGEVKPEPIIPATPAAFVVGGSYSGSFAKPNPTTTEIKEGSKIFENEVYSKSIGGYTWILTKGQVTLIKDQVVTNERILESGIYSQIVSTGF